MTTGEPSTGNLHVQAFTLGSTEPFLGHGDEVLSAAAAEGTALDLEPGVYFLADASYGFNMEMVG